MDSTLVRIYNASIHNFLESQMQSRGISLLWIAANDRDVEGDWVWGPDDVVEDAVWKDGEPNNVNEEDCVALKLTSIGVVWEDLSCENNGYPFVACERPFKMLP
ncbi:lectin BRA-3-like [Argopecten irradians]|uniref:lectin BRA-3-like n=1 Tax=Argopecten irradians TaxID=31199 RepID=UPI0037184D1C